MFPTWFLAGEHSKQSAREALEHLTVVASACL